MLDWSKGKVYKVECEASDEIYVGSTVDPLMHRLRGHCEDAVFRRRPNKFFDHIRKHGVQFFNIALLEAWPCASRTSLRKREQHWMDKLGPGLNTRRAYGRKPRVRTKKDLLWVRRWKLQQ